MGAAFDDQKQEPEEASLCVEGTRVDLLKKIQEWAYDRHGRRGFWLTGLAGTGKSTIARTVAATLPGEEFAIGSFFFRRGAGDRQSTQKFVTTIFRQLAKYDDLLPSLSRAWTTHVGVAEKALQYQWRDLIQKPLAGINHRPIMLVIDAVDECGTLRAAEHDIFDFLSDSSHFSGLNIRLFITSRPKARKENIQLHELFRLHAIEENVVEEDIRTFFKAKFSQLGDNISSRHPRFPQPHHIDALAKRASPLFIAAITSYLFITADRSDPQRRYHLLLGDTQSHWGDTQDLRLDEMYLVVIAEVLFDKASDGYHEDIVILNLKRFQTILGSVIALKDTLNYEVLAELLSLNPDLVQRFLKQFRAVLDVPEPPEPVCIFHQSFPDFLLSSARVKKACKHQQSVEGRTFKFEQLWVDNTERNSNLFHNCLDVMGGAETSKAYFKEGGNICRLRGPGDKAATISKKLLDETIPSLLRYACRNWILHFIEGDRRAEDDYKRLWNFLRRHLLHWIEVMSCLGSLSEATRQLDRLHEFLEVSFFTTIPFLW